MSKVPKVSKIDLSSHLGILIAEEASTVIPKLGLGRLFQANTPKANHNFSHSWLCEGLVHFKGKVQNHVFGSEFSADLRPFCQ